MLRINKAPMIQGCKLDDKQGNKQIRKTTSDALSALMEKQCDVSAGHRDAADPQEVTHNNLVET